jgi:hypothetical protein
MDNRFDIPDDDSSIRKYLNIDELRIAAKEFATQHHIFESSAFDLDKKIYGTLKKLIPHDQELDAKWPKQINNLPLPKHIDWLPDNAQGLLIGLCERLVRYHNLPIITDSYNHDHAERRRRRQAIELLFGGLFRQFLDKSKLRTQPIFGLHLIFVSLQRALDQIESEDSRFIELKKTLTDLHNNFQVHGLPLGKYQNWGQEDKMYLAQVINPNIENFLFDLEEIYGINDANEKEIE